MTDNELIAEFMGFITQQAVYGQVWRCHDNEVYQQHEMKFNISWDWLMLVVDKIECIPMKLSDIKQNCRVTIDRSGVLIEQSDAAINWIEVSTHKRSKIEAVYKAVVQFIKWYNANKH